MKKGAEINVFHFIWEVNGQKLSNLVANDQSHAKKSREWWKTVKVGRKALESGQIMAKKGNNLAKDWIHELGPRFGLEDLTTTRDITRFQKNTRPLTVFSVNKFCRDTLVKPRDTAGGFKILHKLLFNLRFTGQQEVRALTWIPSCWSAEDHFTPGECWPYMRPPLNSLP